MSCVLFDSLSNRKLKYDLSENIVWKWKPTVLGRQVSNAELYFGRCRRDFSFVGFYLYNFIFLFTFRRPNRYRGDVIVVGNPKIVVFGCLSTCATTCSLIIEWFFLSIKDSRKNAPQGTSVAHTKDTKIRSNSPEKLPAIVQFFFLGLLLSYNILFTRCFFITYLLQFLLLNAGILLFRK